jgi:hypothetical protein
MVAEMKSVAKIRRVPHTPWTNRAIERPGE